MTRLLATSFALLMASSVSATELDNNSKVSPCDDQVLCILNMLGVSYIAVSDANQYLLMLADDSARPIVCDRTVGMTVQFLNTDNTVSVCE